MRVMIGQVRVSEWCDEKCRGESEGPIKREQKEGKVVRHREGKRK